MTNPSEPDPRVPHPYQPEDEEAIHAEAEGRVPGVSQAVIAMEALSVLGKRSLEDLKVFLRNATVVLLRDFKPSRERSVALTKIQEADLSACGSVFMHGVKLDDGFPKMKGS